jgi:Flp pilus assembly protein CpaB
MSSLFAPTRSRTDIRLWFRRRSPAIAYWAFTLIVAVIAAQLVGGAVNDATSGQSQQVLITARPIAAGEVITASSLRVASVPMAFVPDRSTAASAVVVGRVALHPLRAGAPVDLRSLAPGASSPLAAIVGSGRRGISISTPHSPEGLSVDDRVDVLVNRDGDGALSTAIRGARVARVDEQSVLLSVAPTESEQLSKALTNGVATIVLVGG